MRATRGVLLPNVFLPPLTPTLDAALRDSSSRDPKFRAASAQRLQDPPSERAAEARAALVRLVDDPLGPIRELALDGLAHLGTEAELELVRSRTDDGHEAVRRAAVRASHGIRDDVAWLESLLDDPRPEIRYELPGCMAASEHACEPILIRMLDDEDDDVAGEAARALGERGEGRDALEAALRRGPVALHAAIALAEQDDAAGETILVAALRDPSWRFIAVEALGRCATRAGCDALAALGERTLIPLILKAAAGAALARREDPRGEPLLGKVLRAWRADGRDYAVHAAGELALVGLIPLLERLARRLRGADPSVLGQALQRLAPLDENAGRALALLQRRHPLATP